MIIVILLLAKALQIEETHNVMGMEPKCVV